MGKPADAYNAFRRRVLPGVHSVFDVLLGGYALSDTPPEEYVGTLHCSQDEVEALFEGLGFSRSFVASLKVRVDGNVSDGSWVYRESLFAAHQLHVIVHQTENGVETYAHWEYSSIRHPYRHYLARDYSAEKGVSLTRSLLSDLSESRGVEWTIEPPYVRDTWYVGVVRMVSKPLAKRLVDVPKRFGDGLTEETPGVAQRLSTALRRQ